MPVQIIELEEMTMEISDDILEANSGAVEVVQMTGVYTSCCV